MKKRILTGIKPTGIVHIGNYFGAIKPAIEMSENEDLDCFYFIADYHALNQLPTAQQLKEYTYGVASTWLACGLDPNKVVVYRQSDVPQTFELNWILNNVTPKGLMNRAHAYKACVAQNQQNGLDADAGVNMGLFNYPVLMAADILLFDTNLVPVGQDQQQHIEIARDIAHNFNKTYGKGFVEPQGYTNNNCKLLMGLDGRKMSKSYNNTIILFSDEKLLQKTINRIVTDSKLPGEPKPLDCTINELYKLFATPEQAKKFEEQLSNGLSWGEAKKQLFEVANAYIAPMREKYNYYQQNRDVVDKILEQGAQRARQLAEQKISQIRKLIGVLK